MTVTAWVKNNSRTMGKVALYGTGGVLLGWPLFVVGKRLYNGDTAEIALQQGCLTAVGYNPTVDQWDKIRTRNAIMRDLVGAAAIYAGRKI